MIESISFAGVAQSVVQLIRNQQVESSSLFTSSKKSALPTFFVLSVLVNSITIGLSFQVNKQNNYAEINTYIMCISYNKAAYNLPRGAMQKKYCGTREQMR